MSFEKFFRLISYAAVFFGFLALWVSGTFGLIATILFVAVIASAWFLEDSRWQISERWGTALIVLALPFFYVAYRLQWDTVEASDAVIAGILARMILSLAAIKLLQKKSERDWVFLYLMAFFEVLLAAGLSISPLYLATFLVYLLLMVCAVIAFEMRRTAKDAEKKISRAVAAATAPPRDDQPAIRVLPRTAFVLLILIAIAAIPLFFLLPRVGGAGIGGGQRILGTSTGFSDSVRLGRLGRIQQDDRIAMRVKAEENTQALSNSYFRGVALDRFDNRSWSKSRPVARETFLRGETGFIQLGAASPGARPLLATVYLEPMDTQVVFAVPETLAVQANFAELYRDTYGGLTAPWGSERNNYRFLSDTREESAERLRADNAAYSESFRNYLEAPIGDDDRRYAELTTEVVGGARSRYDKARAVERYLQESFGYTLEQKASGDEPLADFLFNVREGHCEYFASAMAIMLRTQGIATRVVNGFRGGEYNSAVDTLIVRQRYAHSWVEVYFPGEDEWVAYDPTPAASGIATAGGVGFTAAISKYLEALDTLWIQYFVAFDNQEQRSLARSIRGDFADVRATASASLSVFQEKLTEWWAEVRGDAGGKAAAFALGYAIASIAGAAALFFASRFAFRWISSRAFWRRLIKGDAVGGRSVEFYERMSRLLEERGLRRAISQTPLEFASATGIAQVEMITREYHRVRFGERHLSADELAKVGTWLDAIEAK